MVLFIPGPVRPK